MLVQLTTLVLGLVALTNAEPQSFGAACAREGPFDFTMLALQWPPGICYSNIKQQCTKTSDQFVIHGNWPSFVNGSWPEFCCFQRDFDKRKLAEVEDSLKQKWGSLFVGGTDEGFWRHEWKKHGTCAAMSAGLKGQRNYFTESLQMYDKAPIKEWLRKARITPDEDSTKFVSIKALHSAIESQIGNKKVRFECRRLPRRLAREPLISGIYLCYDPISLNYIDCPLPDDPDCGGSGSAIFLSSGTASASGHSGTQILAISLNLILFMVVSKLY